MAGQICQLDGGIRFHRFSKLDIGSSVQISWALGERMLPKCHLSRLLCTASREPLRISMSLLGKLEQRTLSLAAMIG